MPISWPDYLPESSGERVFAGTRIGLLEFLHHYNTLGYSAEMLALEYPTLDLSLIHKFPCFLSGARERRRCFRGGTTVNLGSNSLARSQSCHSDGRS